MSDNDLLTKLKSSSGFPSEARFDRGAVAVIECIQEIPCNPCETACRFNAIVVGKPITNLPKLVEEKCKGCGECISACPGLAIFVVDRNYSEEKVKISIPYEFCPLPEASSIVDALDRDGKKVCEGKVLKVYNPVRNDKTAVISIIVDKEYADAVRNIRLRE